MIKLVIRTIAVFLVAFAAVKPASAYFYNDSLANGKDPLISQLDSLSYSLFTRDKFFVNDDELLASINMPYDAIPKFTPGEIKEKMKLIPAIIPIPYNSQVSQFIDLFAYKRRGLMARCLANSQIYFPIFEAELDKQGLPIELKYLPIVESALNPIAVSSAGATGLWQFMYGTGQLMGLEVNSYIDERRDPIKATEAAGKYLKKLYDMYGDWHLVLAAYNSGPGNVNKAIAKAGGTKNFWAIMNFLPAETRSYVPLYIAATYVMHYHKDYKLVSAEPRRELYTIDTVLITSKVSLKHISTTLGIAEDELQFLNPSIKKGVVPYTQGGFALNLPIYYFALFEARKEEVMNDTTQNALNTEAIIAAAPKLIYHSVKKNETITKVASKYGVTVTSIKKWNRLKNSYVYPGQKVKIYVSAAPKEANSPTYAQAFAPRVFGQPKVDTAKTITTADIELVNSRTDAALDSVTATKAPDTVKTSNSIQLDKSCNCVYYVVQPGDTLWHIAGRNGVSVEKLKADNKVYTTRPIKAGDVVKIVM